MSILKIKFDKIIDVTTKKHFRGFSPGCPGVVYK